MSNITEALREEHQTLLPHMDDLRVIADRLDEMPRHEVCHSLDGVYQFLTFRLLPHAAAEEDTLYPAVAKILGSPRATATMSRDHVEVSRLTEQLGWLRSQGTPLDPEQIKNLRRLLYGLHTLLKVHFAKEEEIYWPLLANRLRGSKANRLCRKIRQRSPQHRRHASTKARRSSSRLR